MPTPKEECREILESHYSRMMATFADLQILQSTIRTSTRRAIQQSLENSARFEAQGEADPSYSLHHMHFRSLAEGSNVFYAKSLRDSEEMRRDMHSHENKQLRWIIVEAYEAYQDFIDVCYACALHLGENLWRADELKRVEDGAGQAPPTLQSLLKTASKNLITGDAYSKVARFRKHFSEVRSAEAQRALGHAPNFVLALVEQLRHIIVHQGGRVYSRKEFEKQVLSKAGVWNNGRPAQMYVNELSFYLAEHQGQYLVRLSSAPTPDLPFGEISRVDSLLDIVLAYAQFIYADLLLPKTAT
jgi:hypothetical protein